MSEHYILEGHTIVETDFMTWAQWVGKDGYHIADEKIGDVLVNTVFLGFDLSFGDGPPLLFETMVFGGSLDQEIDRYATWDEAEVGHKVMVERVKREGY